MVLMLSGAMGLPHGGRRATPDDRRPQPLDAHTPGGGLVPRLWLLASHHGSPAASRDLSAISGRPAPLPLSDSPGAQVLMLRYLTPAREKPLNFQGFRGPSRLKVVDFYAFVRTD